MQSQMPGQRTPGLGTGRVSGRFANIHGGNHLGGSKRVRDAKTGGRWACTSAG